MFSAKNGLLLGLIIMQVSCAIKQADIADGVYWSEKISEYLVVEDGFFRSYQWTPFACLDTISGLVPAAGSVNKPLGQLRIQHALPDQLTLVRISDSMSFYFNRVAQLPSYCGVKVVDTALSQWKVMQQTLELFEQPIPVKTVDSILKTIEQIDARIDDTEYSAVELFNHLAQALASTGDGHAFLYSRYLSLYWSAHADTSNTIRLGGTSFCNDAIHLKNHPQIIIVQVARLHSFDQQQPYQDRLLPCLFEFATKLKSTQSENRPYFLVDLMNNPGGSLNYAAELLAILTGRMNSKLSYIGDLAIHASFQYPTTPRQEQLYVAINKNTVSAAEHLALALKNEGFTAIGETSAGAFSPAIVKTLPNGWFFGFSMYKAIYDTKKKPVPEGVGISVSADQTIKPILIQYLPGQIAITHQ